MDKTVYKKCQKDRIQKKYTQNPENRGQKDSFEGQKDSFQCQKDSFKSRNPHKIRHSGRSKAN